MSMTKLIVSLAAIQLVEKGVLSLDDPAVIEKNLPELVNLDIVTEVKDGKATYKKRTQPITLRHLLTHTNGTGYDVMAPLLGEWAAANGMSGAVFSKNLSVKSFEQPLLFEPGQGWNYGLGLDWGGILVERVTGQSLEDYSQQNIFKPVGASTLTFNPGPKHYEHLQAVTTRDDSGKLFVFPGIRDTSPEPITGQASGGAGLFGTARDYLRVLQGILASQKPGGIISPESFKLIFSNQLPKAPEGTYQGQYDFARLIPHISPELIDGKALTHSLGGFVCTKDSPNGRKTGSDWWEGIYKTFYWMDPTTGVAVSSKQLVHVLTYRACSPRSCTPSVSLARSLTWCSTSLSARFTTIFSS